MSTQEEIVIELPAVLTIADCEAIHQEMQTALESSNEIRVLGEQVEKVDAAALQLLAAFNVEYKKRGNAKEIKYSSTITESANLLGIGSSFH